MAESNQQEDADSEIDESSNTSGSESQSSQANFQILFSSQSIQTIPDSQISNLTRTCESRSQWSPDPDFFFTQQRKVELLACDQEEPAKYCTPQILSPNPQQEAIKGFLEFVLQNVFVLADNSPNDKKNTTQQFDEWDSFPDLSHEFLLAQELSAAHEEIEEIYTRLGKTLFSLFSGQLNWIFDHKCLVTPKYLLTSLEFKHPNGRMRREVRIHNYAEMWKVYRMVESVEQVATEASIPQALVNCFDK